MATKTDVILKALGLDIEGKELTAEEIGSLFKNFKEIKKTLDDYEKKTLKPYFFQGAESFGNQTESGGHRVVLDDGSGWEKQARVSVKVDNESAVNLMKTKHLNEYIDTKEYISEENMEKAVHVLESLGRKDLVTSEESVTESSLEQAYLQEQITDEDLADIITRKTTYALVEVKPPKKK